MTKRGNHTSKDICTQWGTSKIYKTIADKFAKTLIDTVEVGHQ